MGAAMKMVVNLLMGESMLAYAEALVLGESLGIERKAVLDTLLATPIAAPFMTVKRAKIEEGNYDPEFPLKWMQKDFHLASVSAYEGGVSLPAANVGKEIYRLAMRSGLADKDFAAIYDFLSRHTK
jgi:3-hydroxyisobutyrate dehydrogenase/glyoxylate/succinic semialdehyde reductase